MVKTGVVNVVNIYKRRNLFRVLIWGVFFTLCSLFVRGEVWLNSSYAAQHKIFEKSFDRTLCMAEFNNRIFVGVGHDANAKIYRLSHAGCKIWEDVTPLWNANTTGRAMTMAVFNNVLFVGTDKGEIFGTFEGLKWYNVTGNLPLNHWISDMAVFKDYLYVSHWGMTIFRSIDGLTWQPVVGPTPALHSSGFGNNLNHDLNSLEVFNGYLYAGIGRDNLNGIQIWRTSDGIHWSLFQEEVQEVPPPPFLQLLPGHVHAMTVFDNKLYIGEFEGSGVYRTDGSASSWDYIKDSSTLGYGIMRLQGHDGKLYRGNYDLRINSYLNDKILFESSDASTWTTVAGSPVVTWEGVNGIGTLLSARGKLYSGTISSKSFVNDPTSKVQVYEMGESSLNCSLINVNKTIADLKERFADIAGLAALCNPPPNNWPPPESSCFLFVSGYGQSVIPTSASWVYSAIEEIKMALQEAVWPRDEAVIQNKQDLLDEINSEFKLAMELIILAAFTIDSQGSSAVKVFLDEALLRLKHAGQLCDEASYYSGMMLFLPAILSATQQGKKN